MDGEKIVRLGDLKNYNKEMKEAYIKPLNENFDKKYDKTGGTIEGDVIIQGELKVSGTTTTTDTVTLQVKDNIIVANVGGEELINKAGFAVKTAGDAAYGIMYDPIGDGVKIGLGSFNDGEFNYGENEAQFLATRADSIAHENLPKWNSDNNTFEDSGVSISDLQSQISALQAQIPVIVRI